MSAGDGSSIRDDASSKVISVGPVINGRAADYRVWEHVEQGAV